MFCRGHSATGIQARRYGVQGKPCRIMSGVERVCLVIFVGFLLDFSVIFIRISLRRFAMIPPVRTVGFAHFIGSLQCWILRAMRRRSSTPPK
ncbi:Uncharacterised protein [Mycobacteroides abscessus subsp. abscessus]|nr:Uncharacterised protein [Mycobacteroides abscessus subsp. abscessus]